MPASPSAEDVLVVNNIEVVYHDVILVLKGVSLRVPQGRIVTLLGTNGAGKTTTLKAVSGLLLTEDGAVRKGSVELQGRRIESTPAEEIVRRGVVQVLEGRRIFKHLTVEENLRVGLFARRSRGAVVREDLDRVYHYFPRLSELRGRLAGYASGGEQQMLAIGRALMLHPTLLLLDEPSLGLAPLLVQEIFGIVERINREEGTTILLVEQNARMALRTAHYGYIMENGRIVLEGESAWLRENPDVKEFYLGLTESGRRKSYREAKAYRRRKRYM
ncbi:branched-chain amino acid ABC transporter ATP-binding protein [Limnochorda pilosa]|uniref:Branched-chain amino acid ABC transporter ATP-binding protein n=1 Tax=Limnochorda pilosa TaxID=1555112 RepID=A0A0K2SJA1_LIMPI|nr:branched-chain amino acid ABC transporter ATP-binding protein [Limnochorda pilosa]